jgi:phage shock protein A
VATHIDKHHIHNHIIICSTDLEGQHKYRDVKQSAKDLAQISDSLCREHGLSVIQNPQNKTVTYDKWQGNQRRFTHRDELRMIIDTALRMQPDGFDALMQLLEDAGCRIKRGAHISIKPPEGERYIRLDTLGLEYDEASLRRTLAHDHVHIPKIPRGDFTESQVKRLVDIEAKLRAGKGKGYQVWAERNNIDAKAQMIIFLKEHHIGSLEELNDQIQELSDQQNTLKSSIREKQNRMKEINRQRQAIRDYSRTKEVYTQYRESGWSVKFYQEHRQEIEDHRNAQAVYSSHDGKMPTLKELTAEYDELKERKENDQAALDELKPKLTDLKHIRYNYEILERDSAPKSNQHVIPKDHHFDEHAVHHDDESR